MPDKKIAPKDNSSNAISKQYDKKQSEDKNMPDKKIDPKDNESNMPNRNEGTDGTNRQNAQREGNTGKQLNPLIEEGKKNN